MASLRNSALAEPLVEEVEACLRRHLQPNQSLVVAFSGGRDSVALLHALKSLQVVLGYALSACHVNHRLSSQADNWEAFCKQHCDDSGIAIKVHRVDVPRDAAEGLEAAARSCRYQALALCGGDWLATAHHRGDQAETMLFNMLRGAGLRGAAGMPLTRILADGGSLIRPLLAVSRTSIEAYLKNNGLTWVDDESNSDCNFNRNFLRHDVLPTLATRFPAAEQKLAAAAGRFAEAGRLLDDLALIDLSGQPPRFPLPVACLIRLDEARGRNLLRFLLLQHGVRIPSEQRLSELLRQLKEAKPDRHPAVEFGSNRLSRRRGDVYLD